jgi:beta-galactosidase
MITGLAPANPARRLLYQTNRNASSFSYAIPGLTPGTSYIVDLHFAEVYSSATSTFRAFNVAINGTQC